MPLFFIINTYSLQVEFSLKNLNDFDFRCLFSWRKKYNKRTIYIFFKGRRIVPYPGRTCTVVNDRLRWKTEIYGGRTQDPYTGTVYGVKRWETDTVYGDRIKKRSDLKVTVSTPYTELYDCRIRSYIIVCCRIRSYTVTVWVTFQIHTGSEWIYKQ
jgi:hypothetical protein